MKDSFSTINTVIQSLQKSFGEQRVLSIFDQLLDNSDSIYVAVSGGPDSMILVHLLIYFKTISDKTFTLTLLHYNHGQRDISQKEEQFIRSYFSDYPIEFGNNIVLGLSESQLRKKRKDFFDSVLENSISSKLFTGHHFMDRLETIYMNYNSGCSWLGFTSLGIEHGQYNYKIFSPLYDFSKEDILNLCSTYSIPYFLDETNNQSKICERNFIRNIVFGSDSIKKNGFTTIHNFIDANKRLVSFIDSIIGGNDNSSELLIPNGRPIQQYRKHLITTNIDIYRLTVNQGIYGLNRDFINNIVQKIDSMSTHVFYSNGWNFIWTFGVLYTIQGPREFWNNRESDDFIVNIDGSITLWGVVRHITFNGSKDYIVRTRKNGDIYKGKKLKEFLISAKLPFYIRDSIPVIEYDGIIVDIFPFWQLLKYR